MTVTVTKERLQFVRIRLEIILSQTVFEDLPIFGLFPFVGGFSSFVLFLSLGLLT